MTVNQFQQAHKNKNNFIINIKKEKKIGTYILKWKHLVEKVTGSSTKTLFLQNGDCK